MLEITVHSESAGTRTYSFTKSSIMIGRASGNDILVTDGAPSRYHARVSVRNGKVVVQDLESTNGTFVNSEKVQSLEVGPNDKIAIGTNVIQAVFQADEDESGASVIEVPSPATESTGAEPVAKEPVTVAETKKEVEPEAVAEPVAVVEADENQEKAEGLKGDFYWQSLERFLAPIWEYIVDDSVSEIMINGPEEIYIEKKGRLHLTKSDFGESQLKAAVLNIAQYMGRRVSEEEPYLDARLPDGSRVAILLPPCSRKGISIAIRKFSQESLTIEKLIGFGSLTKEMETFLRACVELKKNVIISGGTSSGKTSLLNVVSGFIPKDERIITIEDSAELQLQQDHVVPMETKAPDKKGRGQVTIRDLVKASLRMRPDRVVVGEIRGGEALDLLQAMNTGHSGSMSTVHASSPEQSMTRLETLALFSGIEIPLRALREQVSMAIDIVVQAARLPDHSRKVTHISEVGRLTADGNYQTTDIFRFEREGTVDGKIQGQHKLTGAEPSFLEEFQLAGMTDALSLFSK